MTIKEFYDFYKTQLLGKFYCSYKEVEDQYHYYKTIVLKEKINQYNVINITRKLLDNKGWIEEE